VPHTYGVYLEFTNRSAWRLRLQKLLMILFITAAKLKLILPWLQRHLCYARHGRERCLMGKTRREFTPEFKREAVALLQSSGRPQMQIVAELGIQPSMLKQ
jgi:hypothetical protein